MPKGTVSFSTSSCIDFFFRKLKESILLNLEGVACLARFEEAPSVFVGPKVRTSTYTAALAYNTAGYLDMLVPIRFYCMILQSDS